MRSGLRTGWLGLRDPSRYLTPIHTLESPCQKVDETQIYSYSSSVL